LQVKEFPIEAIPSGLKEKLKEIPELTGWRLEVLKQLSETVFKKLNIKDINSRSECYKYGYTLGLLVCAMINLYWDDLQKEDEIILKKTCHPAFNPPKVSMKKIKEFGLRFFQQFKEAFFSTRADTIANIKELLKGATDGFDALEVGENGMAVGYSSTRIYFFLLMFNDLAEDLNSVEEIHSFAQVVIQPPSVMLEIESFKKLCNRIGLRGKKYNSIDTHNEACPLT